MQCRPTSSCEAHYQRCSNNPSPMLFLIACSPQPFKGVHCQSPVPIPPLLVVVNTLRTHSDYRRKQGSEFKMEGYVHNEEDSMSLLQGPMHIDVEVCSAVRVVK